MKNKTQPRNKPLVTTPMDKEIISRIAELKEEYGNSKSDIINKALQLGLNELELYLKMEQKFFFDREKAVKEKYQLLDKYEFVCTDCIDSGAKELCQDCIEKNQLNKTSVEGTLAKDTPQSEVAEHTEVLYE